MRAQSLSLTLSLALAAAAVPFNGIHHRHQHRNPLVERQSDEFEITVTNLCPSSLSFGIYQVDASFNMNEICSATEIASGDNGTITAPYSGIGMRLSATADQGAAAQWGAQALFEFGFSGWAGVEGSAYDLSVMGGDVGLSVVPSNPECESKRCLPTDCPLSQGWTNPDQVNQGSPADTVCYHGKTDFHVTWCAS